MAPTGNAFRERVELEEERVESEESDGYVDWAMEEDSGFKVGDDVDKVFEEPPLEPVLDPVTVVADPDKELLLEPELPAGIGVGAGMEVIVLIGVGATSK